MVLPARTADVEAETLLAGYPARVCVGDRAPRCGTVASSTSARTRPGRRDTHRGLLRHPQPVAGSGTPFDLPAGLAGKVDLVLAGLAVPGGHRTLRSCRRASATSS